MDTNQILASAIELHRSGRIEEAARAYQNLLDMDSNNADAFYGLGTVRMQTGDLQKAAELLNRAVALESESPEIIYNYALVLERLGHTDAAGAGYGRAAGLSANDPELQLIICRKLLKTGQAQVAYKFLKDLNPRTMEIEALTVQARAAAGDWPGAVEQLRELSEQGSQSAAVWREISMSAARIHDYATARNAFETYLSLTTPDAADHLAHADLLVLSREVDSAEDILNRENDLDSAEAELIRAKIARFKNRPKESREHLKAAIAARPANAEAWSLLIDIEPDENLPAIAAECRELSQGHEGSERERLAIALAAGRVYDKIGQYSDAFECFRVGNTMHKNILVAAGKSYGAEEIERNFDGIMQRFETGTRRVVGAAPKDQPIFIVGMPRSGTTLVEKILSCFDGVERGGEIMALEFVASQYYQAIQTSAAKLPGQLTGDEWKALVDSYWQWAGRSPCLITDKMPHNFRNVGLINGMFPASPVIYMRRDARDVCLSIYSRDFMDGHSYACDLEWMAHFYAQSVRIMEYWQKQYPDRVLEVAYEELVAEPEPMTRKIAAFCGLKWDPSCLQFEKKDGASFTFSEIQVRKPLNRDGLERWRNYQAELESLSKLLTDNKLI